MLNCCNGDFCADNHNYFQFKLKDKGRSAGSAATQVQVCDSTLLVVDVPVVQLHRCCSWIDGLTFLGRVHTFTARFSPAIWAGKGWRGRRKAHAGCSHFVLVIFL